MFQVNKYDYQNVIGQSFDTDTTDSLAWENQVFNKMSQIFFVSKSSFLVYVQMSCFEEEYCGNKCLISIVFLILFKAERHLFFMKLKGSPNID